MSFPLNFWQLYLTTQKAIHWSCQKKSAVQWLAEWAEQNTISGMGFRVTFLFLWTTQWRNGLLVSNEPLRKSSNHERLTSPWEAILHHPRGPEILVQIRMPWQMLPVPSLHAWFMHACHTHGRGTKQTRKRQGCDEEAPAAHTKETALIRANKSMSLDQKVTQTLGRSMSSSGKCGRVKNHKYADVSFTIASCC